MKIILLLHNKFVFTWAVTKQRNQSQKVTGATDQHEPCSCFHSHINMGMHFAQKWHQDVLIPLSEVEHSIERVQESD